MKCPDCGKENASYNAYCGFCGTEIPESLRPRGEFSERADESVRSCPQCGAELKEGVISAHAHMGYPAGPFRLQWNWQGEKKVEPLTGYGWPGRMSALRCPSCGLVILRPVETAERT